MRQFINASEPAFNDLERQARNACVVFQHQEMPLGSLPDEARVGFEVNQTDGSAALFVQRGIVYSGTSQEIRSWLEAGEKRFSDFAELRRWIQEELGPCYERHQAGPEELTDLDKVKSSIKRKNEPLCIEEGALFEGMAKLVRGQDDALRMLCKRVSLHVSKPAPRRPATFFAVGPTGVGKTKTSEALPQVLKKLDPKGAGYNYLRLDMSEYQESHRISQILGAPQGYIGYGDGAQLVDALSLNPKTVVLFDEIEKAHPNILKALMNAMDAGRLSTASGGGREIDCRWSVFLFTSNLEADRILDELEGRNASNSPAVVDQVCRLYLRQSGIASELIGRIGCFLVFHPLTIETRAEIITLSIACVAEEYGIQVAHIAPSVIVKLLEEASSGEFGARPDEYFIDEMLGPAFARAVAAGIKSPVRILGHEVFECVPVSARSPTRS